MKCETAGWAQLYFSSIVAKNSVGRRKIRKEGYEEQNSR